MKLQLGKSFAVFCAISFISALLMSSFAWAEPNAKEKEQVQEGADVVSEVDCEPQTEVDSAMPISSIEMNVTTEPVVNTTTVKLWVENANDLLTAGMADSLEVSFVLPFKGKPARKGSASYALSELAEGVAVDFGNYGRFDVTFSWLRGDVVVNTSKTVVDVVAENYNIAALMGTLPTTYVTANYWNINHTDDGTHAPTIIALTRPQSLNWDALPEGMYLLPYVSKPEDTRKLSNFFAMGDYVKMLYEITPEANFNFFVNDYHLRVLGNLVYANNLPMENVKVTFISDGSATASTMNRAYGGSNPNASHESYVKQWGSYVDTWYKAGKVDESSPEPPSELLYAAVCSMPNSEWWVTRKSLFTSGDDNAFAATMTADSRMIQKNISNDLTALKDSGHDQEFRNLYNFKGDFFSKADSEGKKVMLLMGTHTYNEKNFDDYVNLVESFYGTDYIYYYKGHPAYPTQLDAAKQKRLESLGLIDIDSTIPAELILFYYPDIYMTGYNTSTFNSALPESKGGVWGYTKEESLTSGTDISENDWYASPRSGAPDEIKAWMPKGRRCYSIEFSDVYIAAHDYSYDFAIYDATINLVTFYKGTGEDAKVVKTMNGGKILRSDNSAGSWKKDNRGWWYRKSNGSYTTNGWQLIGGKWYLFDSSGYMRSGWVQFGGSRYYLGGSNDGAMKTSWYSIDGRWYLFDENGSMLTGWQKDRNAWYYLGNRNNASMRTGWNHIGGHWYLMSKDGVMLSGWQFFGGSWYYLGAGKDDGAMKTGWVKDGDTWYLLGSNGAMKTGWQKVGKSWYWMDKSGAMASNRWVGPYWVDESGAWDPSVK